MVGKEIASNMFYINAPAGSGKTHFIKEEIERIIDNNPNARVLCITYTERAAKELQSRILSKETQISTIHSFINSFISPYYEYSETINLYYEMFYDDVFKRIQENALLATDDPDNRNTRYLLSNDLDIEVGLSVQLIKDNTKAIYYNERNFNSLYYGGLSHDNLLKFAFAFLEKYPILQYRLKEMFQFIFVDEVQDTATKVLKLFFNAVKGTKTQLYYFGDKMQEIYDNYDGGFEEEYNEFDSSLSQSFTLNYRSSEEIVNILNNLYGRKGDDRQKAKKGINGINPQLIVCHDKEIYYAEHSSELEGFLLLRIANRARFARANENESMESIFDAVNRIYPYGSRLSAIEVLLPPINDESPDEVIRFYYSFGYLVKAFKEFHYAEVIRLLSSYEYKATTGRRRSAFCSSMVVERHDDKTRLHKLLSRIIEEYSSNELCSLNDFLVYLRNEGVINNEYVDYINQYENDDGVAVYDQLLNIKLAEMRRLIRYKDKQSVSTQHGVKGEGHSKVCFWCEDSSRVPRVSMYDFLRMYTTLEQFNFEAFQSFYYQFKRHIELLEMKIGMKMSKIENEDIQKNIDILDQLIERFRGNIYFDHIFDSDVIKYDSKRAKGQLPVKTFIRSMLSHDVVNRILVAYKLFYVGCSRAKDNLKVLVSKSEISAFENEFRTKMEAIGFQIVG